MMFGLPGCGAPETVPPPADDSILPSGVEDGADTGDVDDGVDGGDVVVGPAGVDPPAENQPPAADAGPDRSVNAGDTVLLDGSASDDPDGDAITYRWTLADSNIAVDLIHADRVTATFVAPEFAEDTILHFTLTVGDGQASSSDQVSVEVLAPLTPASAGPVADAGPDQTVEGGAIVSLDGTQTIVDGPAPVRFQWTQVAGANAVLNGATTATATFTAPLLTAEAALTFELTVTQNDLTSTDRVQITVRATAPSGGGGGSTPLPPPPPPPPGTTDNCPNDPNKTDPGVCGCGVSDVDTDGDGTPDCNDGCANDVLKTSPGLCGCGVTDADTDGDGTPNCRDGCPADRNKTAAGTCGCGVADTDTDLDGAPDCNDGCPSDRLKTSPGLCGCGITDADTDGDGTPNCRDGCPADRNKTSPGTCGCGVADIDADHNGTADCLDPCPAGQNGDADADGAPDCRDGCPNDPLKTSPGACGCGVTDADTDRDGTPNCRDACPSDPNKIAAGVCGCGVADTDSDADGVPNCNDGCPSDRLKTAPGVCGCGVADSDTDRDGTPDCRDGCPSDPNKIAAGACGCGVADVDSDLDGAMNCVDGCPNDRFKTAPGTCGCGVADTDSDHDGTPNCRDGCPSDPNKVAAGACGCGVADTDSDGDGAANCVDGCPNDRNKTAAGICGCGVADTDTDRDGTADCRDGCPSDATKLAPGVCGCGVPDTDSDADGVANCRDGCPNDRNKTVPGACGCGTADTDRDGDGTADCLDGCPDDPTTTDPSRCQPVVTTGPSDWDLYMLRLVNRARRDPAGEPARIGSSVTDSHVPVQPMAYDLLVGTAATNHNNWMHDNFGSIASSRTPDSFSHFETLDGAQTGTPATGTPSYTGASAGARLTAAGYPWSTYGENIQTNYASFSIPITQARIDISHKNWWESSGHRANMLNGNFTAFGFRIETRTFVAPRGGLNAPFSNIMFATQSFGRPLSTPRAYVFGLFYDDKDGNRAWTPRDVGNALREGVPNVAFQVRQANTTTVVTSGTTMSNGAFSAKVNDGTYDVVFTSPSIPSGTITRRNLVVAGSNVEVGDVEIRSGP